jgi:hypothetical protein
MSRTWSEAASVSESREFSVQSPTKQAMLEQEAPGTQRLAEPVSSTTLNS